MSIFDTSLTWEDLQQKILEVFDPKAILGPNKQVKDIGKGKGNVGKVCLVEPDWKEPIEPKQFIIKICLIPKDGNMDTDYASTTRKIHNVECATYNLLMKYRSNDILIPRVYATVPFTEANTEKGFILMEYIDDAYCCNICENLGIEEVKQALRLIAALQAISLRFTPEERSSIVFNPLREIFSQVKMSTSSASNNVKMTNGVLSRFIAGTYVEQKTQKFLQMLPDIYDLDFLYGMGKELGIDPVLVHGDAWSTNFLWRKTASGELKLVAIVDFQTAYLGNPGGDVMRVISTFLAGKERIDNWNELIEYFYNTFLEFIEHRQPPYSLEQLKENIRRYYPLVRLVFAIPQNFDQNKDNFTDEDREKMKELLLEKLDSILDGIIESQERNEKIKRQKRESFTKM